MVSDRPGATSFSSSRVTTTYSPPPTSYPFTTSAVSTSSPLASSTFLYRIRCDVPLFSWWKLIVWSAVAGYRPTGTLTSPKVRKPDQMAHAISPARSYAARLPQGMEGTLAGGNPMLNLLPAEQVGQLLGVDRGVVAGAVVEQDVGGLGLLGQGTDPGCPAGELGLGVPVAEPLVDVLAVPVLGLAVHAHHRQVGRGREHRGDRAGEALRHGHAHIRQGGRRQELHRRLLVVGRHPGPAAELHAPP